MIKTSNYRTSYNKVLTELKVTPTTVNIKKNTITFASQTLQRVPKTIHEVSESSPEVVIKGRKSYISKI